MRSFLLSVVISVFAASPMMADHVPTSYDTSKFYHYNYDYKTGNYSAGAGPIREFGQGTAFDSSNNRTVGTFWNGAANTGIGGETVDWGDFKTPSVGVRVNGFTIAYATDSQDDVGMTINFYQPNTVGGIDPVVQSFSLTLPGFGDGSGAFFGGAITIDLEGGGEFNLGPNFEYGYQYDSLGNGVALGPLLTAEDLVNAPGTVDTFTTVNASFWDEHEAPGQIGGGSASTLWFGDPAGEANYAQFFMTIFIPEPSSAIILAGGMFGLIMRRRR